MIAHGHSIQDEAVPEPPGEPYPHPNTRNRSRVLFTSWDGGAYNGMQLRLLPEPTSAVIAGAAMIAVVCNRRRKM